LGEAETTGHEMRDFPASLGFKLNLDWREAQKRGKLPAFDGDLYALLKRSGFDYFEFSTDVCTDEAELADLGREVQACAACGLGVALHPYVRIPPYPAGSTEIPEAAEVIEPILSAASMAAEATDHSAHMILHSAGTSLDSEPADRTDLRKELVHRSKMFFAQLEKRAAEAYPCVRPLVEHHVPPIPEWEPMILIGDTYAELLDVVAHVGLGICWDTGHYIGAILRHGQDEHPPEEFLRRVEGMHLHDVVDGVDHCLISQDSLLVRDYVQTMLARGFRGGMTLEYGSGAINATGSFERVIGDSTRLLAEWAE
jgi:sugar phosphate isomerase/epimerase